MTASPAYDDWVARAREADIMSVATRLGAKLKRAGREWVGPCPSCGGRDRFGVNPQKRVFICRGAGGGDVVEMVKHVQGYAFAGAVAWITGEQPPNGRSAGVDPAAEERARRRRADAERKQTARDRAEARKQETARQTASHWWKEADPLIGSVGEVYLRARGIDFDLAPYSSVLRCHRGIAYPYDDQGSFIDNGPVFPALVCAVQHHSGRGLGLWRIYLRADGRDKAPVWKPKLGKGPCRGGGVWLGPRSGIINTCEGVETGLGIVGILGGRETVVATLSTSGMVSFDPAPDSRIRIWPDPDADRIRRLPDGSECMDPSPGLTAAATMAKSLTARGFKVSIQPSKQSAMDYLDVYVKSATAR